MEQFQTILKIANDSITISIHRQPARHMGLHLTSNYQQKAPDASEEEWQISKPHIFQRYPTIIRDKEITPKDREPQSNSAGKQFVKFCH